jgi:hypothetical protein
LVPQARDRRFQIGSTAAMKPDRHGWFGARGVLSQPTDCSAERLPEIVGEVRNPVLETMRCLWWQAFDQICGLVVLIWLSIEDRIYGPEPPTSADLEREANYGATGQGISAWSLKPSPRTKHYTGQNPEGNLGSPYR